MPMYSRRDFGKLAIAGLPISAALAKINSVVHGVHLGACTYSFRDLPHSPRGDAVDNVIQAMKDCGAGECELFSPQLEPASPMTTGGRPGGNGPGGAGQGGGSPADAAARAAAMRARMNSPEAKKAREDLRQWRLSTPMDHFKQVRKKFDDSGIDIYAYTLNFRDAKDFH